ncbi:TM2 domain-containing protein [Nonlabens ponticola]|uniref:TM2 domain-containing protein n=1 Tax=Nonlabens ponticola TaxID=2496866 RepID=A0A3S9MWD0_9FLAO|nr:TM2 domain-containing protein [Nonlabens ponticola]AZQ43490.1 TM2 domain-containing protein [Nonlabens ponticola]
MSDTNRPNDDSRFDSTREGFKQSANEFKDGLDDLVHGQNNKKLIAGLMGIFFGGLGIHKFVLGYTQEGLILLGTTLLSLVLICVVIGAFTIYIPVIIGFIEGIIYLTKSDEEFYQMYQVGRKPWF